MAEIPTPESRNTRDLLRAARELITPSRRWGRGKYEAKGRYCSLGAVAAVSTGKDKNFASYFFTEEGWNIDSVLTEAFQQLYREGQISPKLNKDITTDVDDIKDVVDYGTTAYWNDSLTHAEVLMAFDRAIESSSQ